MIVTYSGQGIWFAEGFLSGVTRLDGFMQNRNIFCLLSLSLLLSPAWGCRLDEPEHNIYQRHENGVIYLRPYEETNLSLPGVNYKRLRRLPDLLIDPTMQEDGEKEPPLTDLTTDYLYEGAQAWFPHYSYHSDGRYVLYAGKVVQNPPGTPPVDVASFRVWGDFAADKNSLYYKGERTDDNHGENHADIKTLRKITFDGAWQPDWLGLILRDDRYLYVNGHRLVDPDSFTVLAQKPWYRHGNFSSAFNPCVAVSFGPWDTLSRTHTKIMINGEQLNANPDTFTVVRWIPDALLTWRDKNGQFRHVLNQDNLDRLAHPEKHCAAFSLLETQVLWRKGSDCQQEEIPHLDPEQFHPLSSTVAQYQDKLYAIRKTEFGENRLDVITLDNPNLIIDKRFNAGRHHGYLLNKSYVDGEEQDGLQVFESAGPLILLDYHAPDEREAHLGDSPHDKKWYARDDRYVYAFDGQQLWRYPTPNPKAVRVKWQKQQSGYGYWAEFNGGDLDGDLLQNGVFIPTGIPRVPGEETAQIPPETNDDSFDIGKTVVRWRKALSPDAQWSNWQTIPNIDPGQFKRVNARIAQYKNQLYIVKLSPFGEDQMEILELDTVAPFLNQKINAGKEHGYFMRGHQQHQDIQVFGLNGSLKITERFAYDNAYVYTWIGDQLYRTASPCPGETRNLDQNMFTSNEDIIIITKASECKK